MTTSDAVVHLHDRSSGSQAAVFVAFGCNCYRFSARIDGTHVEVLWAAEGFEEGGHRPSGSGIPILFPFPGRIQGTTLNWDGKSYELPEGDGRGNAIHGFVHERPWRVLSRSDTHVTAQFKASIDDPSLLASWPSDFCITATYRLAGTRLASYFELSNPGHGPLPCGFGLHPYFRVPLTAKGRADACRLVVPATRRWVLHEMNATGEQAPLAEAAELAAGMPLGDRRWDDVLTALASQDDGRRRARIDDPLSGLAVQLDFDSLFRECVVYTPDHREAVCIEPYTCAPDPFRLAAAGFDAGLQVLPPAGRLAVDMTIEVLPSQ